MLAHRHTYFGHALSREAAARPSAPCKNPFDHGKIGSITCMFISPHLHRRSVTATAKQSSGGTMLLSLPCFSLLDKKFVEVLNL